MARKKLIRSRSAAAAWDLDKGSGQSHQGQRRLEDQARAIGTHFESALLYSQSLGVAIAQTTYATDAGGEIQALRHLLEAVDLEGVLVQADALHANRPFSSTSPSAAPTS